MLTYDPWVLGFVFLLGVIVGHYFSTVCPYWEQTAGCGPVRRHRKAANVATSAARGFNFMTPALSCRSGQVLFHEIYWGRQAL